MVKRSMNVKSGTLAGLPEVFWASAEVGPVTGSSGEQPLRANEPTRAACSASADHIKLRLRDGVDAQRATKGADGMRSS
jgi:hypothetical protein